MKNNFKLSILLILLLGGVYYIEEVYKVNVHKSQLKNVLKVQGEITEVKTPNYTLSLQKKNWAITGVEWKVDKRVSELFINIFKNIKYSDILSEVDERAFQNSILVELKSSEGQRYQLEIGRFSTITGRFYIRDVGNKKIFIAFDDSLFKDVYTNEIDLAGKKFLRFKELLNNKKHFFNKRIFNSGFYKKIDRIIFDSYRNKNFELNLVEQAINPLPPQGVDTLKLKATVESVLNAITLKNIYPQGRYILGDKRSSLTFLNQRQERTFSLFLSLNGKYGHYLREKGSSNIFEINKKDALFFLSSSQDFWNKKINYGVDFQKIKRIDFQLKKMNQSFEKFFIDDIEKFEVKSKTKKINFISKVHMNFLFNLIFNLADFKQAKYIRIEKKFLRPSITMKIFNKTLDIKVSDGDILVFDKKLQLVYFYDNSKNQIDNKFFTQLFNIKEQKNMVK